MDQQTLIDTAVSRMASEAKLAQRLGTTPQKVNDWRKGRRPCPDAVIVRIAELLGMDPESTLGQIAYRRVKGEDGPAPGAGVVATLQAWAVSAAVLAVAAGEALSTMYRLSTPKRVGDLGGTGLTATF